MSIIGYENEKAEISELKNMLLNAEDYKRFGIRIPKGVVLWGEPGVGKTVLAKSLVADGINLIEFKTASCGDDAAISELKRVFSEAKENTPCVILLDELDKIAGTNENFFMENNDEIKKALLQELDEISSEDRILVAATCNKTEPLGEALLRAGRFDRQIFIDTPNEETRRRIIEYYFSKLNMELDLDLDYISHITVGYTGADIECLANESGIITMRNSKETISLEEVRKAMNKLSFNGLEKSISQNAEELRAVSYHEAGHTVVAMFLVPSALHGASILPQGNSEGHILFIPEKSALKSAEDVENEVAVLLGGKAAEMLCYGKFFMGVQSDIHRAVQKITNLTTTYCAYGYRFTPAANLNRFSLELLSEKAKDELCAFLDNKLTSLENKALEIIKTHYDIFEKIADELIEKQTLSREEIFEIKDAFMKKAS